MLLITANKTKKPLGLSSTNYKRSSTVKMTEGVLYILGL